MNDPVEQDRGAAIYSQPFCLFAENTPSLNESPNFLTSDDAEGIDINEDGNCKLSNGMRAT